MKKIFVTGASGFIGKSLCQTLVKSNKFVRGAVRSKNFSSEHINLDYISMGDINLNTNWREILTDFNCIIHCAGRAHVMKERDINVLEAYRSLNVHSTRRLAEQAAAAGVKRFIYLSSVKVNGEATGQSLHTSSSTGPKKNIFTYDDIPAPEDSYGISKWEAEKVLLEVSARTGLNVIIIRSPLVYGKGVKGNLARLLKLIRTGIPLPFSLVKNQRSMIGLDNLVDVIIRCIDHPSAVGKTFLVSDGIDLSTPNLLNHIAFAMGHSVRLFPIPVYFLQITARIFGKQRELDRLIGSLRIDSSYTQKILDWKPPVSIAEGIKRMVQS
jgi:nucleoside-diphosphate-sugar epimerase